jgi:DNA mismatch endonuclease (patch repair protein)
MRHVGNAVPPLLARAVRDRVVEDLANYLLRSRGSEAALTTAKEDPKQRSATMRAVPSRNTTAELKLRKALSESGIRGYRTHSSKLPGSPDLVFARAKLVIFVDGCFWHGCPKCYRKPATNEAYWRMKVERNRDRDKKVRSQCIRLGWTVARVWEHEIRRDPIKAANKVAQLLKRKKDATRRISRRKRQVVIQKGK